jgi:ribonuclease T2
MFKCREPIMIRISSVAFFVLTAVTGAVAQVKLDGTFKATQTCPALFSIKKASNPGNVNIAAGTTYRLLGKNKDNASHYWIEVPDAKPQQRWVALACGTTTADVAAAAPSPKLQKDASPFFVLALSWQPAFCESKPDKTECKNQTATRYDASNFTLHGLWPQPRRNVFCGVDKATIALDDQRAWDKLPAPQLTADTKVALDKVMPGTQSLLERHEWIKHGSCYGDAEAYFKDSIRLTEAVNASVVQDFVAANIGKKIQTADLRAKFDEAFGPGAGNRVRVSCDKAGLISELTIGMKGNISVGTKLADLMAASTPTDAGCPAGLVDAVN